MRTGLFVNILKIQFSKRYDSLCNPAIQARDLERLGFGLQRDFIAVGSSARLGVQMVIGRPIWMGAGDWLVWQVGKILFHWRLSLLWTHQNRIWSSYSCSLLSFAVQTLSLSHRFSAAFPQHRNLIWDPLILAG